MLGASDILEWKTENICLLSDKAAVIAGPCCRKQKPSKILWYSLPLKSNCRCRRIPRLHSPALSSSSMSSTDLLLDSSPTDSLETPPITLSRCPDNKNLILALAVDQVGPCLSIRSTDCLPLVLFDEIRTCCWPSTVPTGFRHSPLMLVKRCYAVR